jgi:hypothetical protein
VLLESGVFGGGVGGVVLLDAPAVGGERRVDRIALAAVADLGRDRGRPDRGLGEDGQRDWASDFGEGPGGAGLGTVTLGAQLVGDLDAASDEILTSARERAQRLHLIAVGHQDAEATRVSAGELGQRERFEAVAAATGRREPQAHRRDLVRVHRDHRQAGVEQPLDQEPVWSLGGDQCDLELEQHRAHRPMFTAAGGELPSRVLIDRALRARLPVAAQATSTDRREPLVSRWPSSWASTGGALPGAAGTAGDAQ